MKQKLGETYKAKKFDKKRIPAIISDIYGERPTTKRRKPISYFQRPAFDNGHEVLFTNNNGVIMRVSILHLVLHFLNYERSSVILSNILKRNTSTYCQKDEDSSII